MPMPDPVMPQENATGGPLDMTVARLMKHWHDMRPKWPALLFVDANPDYGIQCTLTFQEMYVLGARLAHVLKSRGTRRDDSVLCFLRNSVERAIVEAACQLLGCFTITATCSEIDASDLIEQVKRYEASTIVMDRVLHRKEWQRIQEHTQLYDPEIGRIYCAKMQHLYLVFHTQRLERLDSEKDLMYWLRNCCSEEYHGDLNIYPHEKCAALRVMINKKQKHRLAVHTHRNMVAYSKVFMPKTHSPRPIYYNDMPFDTPQGHISTSLCNPITRVLLDQFYGPPVCPEEACVEAMFKTKCPIIVLPSRTTRDICRLYCSPKYGARNPDWKDHNVNKLVFIGILGEASKNTVLWALKAAHLVILSYASAELLLPSVTCVSLDSPLMDNIVGIPIQPGVFVRIVDDEDRELIEGFTGYIQIRSPLMFKCYLNDKEANEQCWTKDGYFKTRDAGYVKKGFLYIATRYASMAYSGILKEERANELGIGQVVTPKDQWPF